jgi:hypothetical protein
MADAKISALPDSTTPLAGTEVLPIVQSGVTKKVANNDLRPKQIQSNATSGVLQVAGPASASTRVMTTPDADFSAARIDAAQSFTGSQKFIGNAITSLDQTGSYAVASFGKTGILDNTATDICILTGDSQMFGFVEILYAIEDQGTDVYAGRKTYRMYWAGGTALLNLISSEDSGVLVPVFTISGSGNNVTIKVTANSIAATVSGNFTIRWHTYGVPFSAIAITEA